MSDFVWFLITLAAAVAGGYVLNKLKFPAGALVGALIVVGTLNVLTGRVCMPSQFKAVAKSIAGLFIGMNVTMEMVKGLKKLIKPAIILVIIILSFCLLMGMVLTLTTRLDVVTSLFCVAPGGMMDMTLMSLDLGGDGAVVAVLQVMRLLSVYCVSMPLVKLISKRTGAEETASEGDKPKKEKLSKAEKNKRMAFSALVCAVGGSLGYILAELADFSVLVMVTAMVVSAAVNIRTGKLYMPKGVRRFAQMLSGALIGLNVTYDSLINIKAALVPAVLVCGGFVFINVVLAYVLHKTCKIDMSTAMLSTSAGGASESALVALDFGAQPATVSVLQVCRLACTTAFYPLLVKFVIPLLTG